MFEYPFIPRAPGVFEVDPVEFTYYDIASGRYRTLSSGPLTIKVGEGKGTDAAVIPSGAGKRSVESIGKDIRFISTVPRLKKAGSMMVASPAMYIVPILVVLAAAAVWILLGRSMARRSDVAGTRNRKALKVAVPVSGMPLLSSGKDFTVPSTKSCTRPSTVIYRTS